MRINNKSDVLPSKNDLESRQQNLGSNEVKNCEHLKAVTIDLNLLILVQKKIVLDY